VKGLEDAELVVETDDRLDRALRVRFPAVSWSVLRRAISTGKVFVAGEPRTDPAALVARGAQITVRLTARRPPVQKTRLSDGVIVHLDPQLVVIDKPPGLSTVPYQNEPGALTELLPELLAARGERAGIAVVHRLDRGTSGLLMFARTPGARTRLAQQLRKRSVTRRYLAIAAGAVEPATFRSHLVRDRGDGRRGSTRLPNTGKLAITHVEVVERLREATLVRCRLETGRTHQIRIHLAEAGHPLLGDTAYGRRDVPVPPAPRLMLHAAVLELDHPTTGRRIALSSPMPDDMRAVVARLAGPLVAAARGPHEDGQP
jgi:23S rRNA pseudouridine1911/1915/1917 synthase